MASGSAEAMLRRGRARFFLAREQDETVDWTAIAVDLEAGLREAAKYPNESDEYWAETWAICAWCYWHEAQKTEDEAEFENYCLKVLNAVDKALEIDKKTLRYSFVSLDKLGGKAATCMCELTGDEKYNDAARDYAKLEFNRKLDEKRVKVELK
jgi:hypothetical protein